MFDIIYDTLEKYSYTNDNGENVIPISDFEEIIEEIINRINEEC